MSSILIYSDYGSISAEILEEIASSGVPIVIHRRNISQTVYVHTGLRPDAKDTLSAQILTRKNKGEKDI